VLGLAFGVGSIQKQGCLSCHKGIEPASSSHDLACTECHGGNERTRNKKITHQAFQALHESLETPVTFMPDFRFSQRPGRNGAGRLLDQETDTFSAPSTLALQKRPPRDSRGDGPFDDSSSGWARSFNGVFPCFKAWITKKRRFAFLYSFDPLSILRPKMPAVAWDLLE